MFVLKSSFTNVTSQCSDRQEPELNVLSGDGDERVGRMGKYLKLVPRVMGAGRDPSLLLGDLRLLVNGPEFFLHC